MVKFTRDFAADDDNGAEAYDAFIVELRNLLATGDWVESVPVLAEQVPPGGALEFFDINLTYNDRGEQHIVQLRFRTDNLYFVGYRPQNSNIWFELAHEDGGTNTLIQDQEAGRATQLLPLGENYCTLTEVAGMRLEDIPLSSSRIGAAITTLATDNGAPANEGNRARAILTLVFAIAEAARFRDISRLISNAWWTESAPGTQYANRVRSWCRLSRAVQRTRNEGHGFDFNGESTGIWSFVEAILALGIMHYAANLPSTSSRPKRSVPDMTYPDGAFTSNTIFPQGQQLLEIFYVRVNNIDDEDPGQLYGSVIVTDSIGVENIWSRGHHSYVNTKPGQDILLEGPSRALSSSDEFYINIDLWDYDTLSPDDSIAQGRIIFNPSDYFTEHDVVKIRDVHGHYGSVTISYMVMTDGLYASIEVILINGDNEDPANVFGEIVVNNGHGQSELFRKASNEYVDVSPLSPIPLSRSVVAVPTTDKLLVNAELWDYDTISANDEIARGSVEFTPRYKQSESLEISGAYGKVEVRVTWM